MVNTPVSMQAVQQDIRRHLALGFPVQSGQLLCFVGVFRISNMADNGYHSDLKAYMPLLETK